MVGYEFVGTAINEDEDELPASMSLMQRIAPSVAEFERARDDVTGSRRLKGAFSGGWDRSVVSEQVQNEWKPASFISSRSNRAQAKASTLEDLVDEEDIRSLGERIQPHQTGAYNAVVIPARGARGRSKGYDLLSRTGWKVGSKLGEQPSSASNTRTIGPQLPPSRTRAQQTVDGGIGRFLEDVAKRKADRYGVGSTKGTIATAGGIEQASGPVAQKEFADDDDGVYEPDKPRMEEEDDGPQIAGWTGDLRQNQRDTNDNEGMEAHSFVRGFLVAERLDPYSGGPSQQDSDHGDVDWTKFRHNFEADPFKGELQISGILQSEVIRVQNVEQRRLVLGEKALPRSAQAESRKDSDGHLASNRKSAEGQRKELMDSLGGDVHSRFVSVGTEKNAPTAAIEAAPKERGLMLSDSQREEAFFQPLPLLCKRFNVPHTELNIAKIITTQQWKTSRFSSAGIEFANKEAQRRGQEPRQGVREPGVGENEALEPESVLDAPVPKEEKPSSELFQAIFGEDSD
ncbi:hypothetical protein NDN08_003176 [Rhodosorus marinus]|uniref:G patch domain-containing protein n=1 Tax=Rhodosorus marinus TaxID=101924 RepID=A0AAV8V1L7_9RHOD|nr:hypothetical protein NDN08_003176 [Rhodosorus marinus]